MRKALIAVFLVWIGVAPAWAQEQLDLFFGLLHAHTSFSDGLGRPGQAYRKARASGLDFLALTEHNHREAGGDGPRRDGIFLTPPLYEELKQAADAETAAGEFVALYGQEFSTISRGNHVNIFNASEICNVANGDFRTLYSSWLPDHPEVPFIQFNHPNARADREEDSPSRRNNDYGIDDYGGSFEELVEASRDHVALIEMIIGPAFGESESKPHHDGEHEPDYLFYLNQGFRLGVSVGQDNHNENWGTSTHARLGVWAPELTRDGILGALNARRCYASEDENIRVRFLGNGRWMGDLAQPNGDGAVELEIGLEDPDEPSAAYRLDIFYDDAVGGEEARVLQTIPVQGNQARLTFRHLPRLGGYYFLKVTQSSNAETDHEDEIWTSPIWVEAAAGGTTGEGGDEDHEDREVISWDEAEDFIGLEKVVTGRIVRTFNSGGALFLNFDPDFQNSLNLVILSRNFAAFGGAESIAEELMGKKVRVKGRITLFRNRTQILLDRRDQILSVSE